MKSADEILASFDANVEAVRRLIRLDELVIRFAVEQIRAREGPLKAELEKLGKRLPERLSSERTIRLLENIRGNQSFQPEYEVMFNQAVVLLVSHFASALHDLFRHFFQFHITEGRAEAAMGEEIKVSFRRLLEINWDVRSNAADLFLTAQDISFQDMQSVSRSFKKWLGYSVTRDKRANNIILGQAARHAIVHAGAYADDRFMSQVRGAAPRDLKPEVTPGERLSFTPVEIEALIESMISYLISLRQGVEMTT
jgi:hypothetical protein